MVPFEYLGAVSYSPSIVTMALSCILHQFRDKARYWSKIVIFASPLAFEAPVRGSPSEYCHPVQYGKTRIVGLPDGEKTEGTCSRLDTIPACDGRTDRQTSCHGIVRAMHTRCAVMMSCRFSRLRISAILDFRGPIMGYLKSPCEFLQVVNRHHNSKLLSFVRKSRFSAFGDRQTVRQTNKETNKQMESIDALSRSRCRKRRLNNGLW